MAEVLNWFSFKGTKCTAVGVNAERLPPITIAEERVEFEPVLGRSGTLTMVEGDAVFEDMVLPIECHVENIDQLNGMAAWLFGSGPLVLPNRPGGYYIGRVVNKMELERVINSRENRRFTVNFRVEPYFYLDDSADITSTAASLAISNPGNAESAPRITIYGSGDFGFSIGGQLVILKNITNGIILDTVLQDALALDEAQLLNNNMSGDFPTIPTGVSMAAWYPFDENDNAGTVTKIVITPRWRCR